MIHREQFPDVHTINLDFAMTSVIAKNHFENSEFPSFMTRSTDVRLDEICRHSSWNTIEFGNSYPIRFTNSVSSL